MIAVLMGVLMVLMSKLATDRYLDGWLSIKFQCSDARFLTNVQPFHPHKI